MNPIRGAMASKSSMLLTIIKNKVEPIKPLICNNLLPHTVLLVPLRWSCRRVSRVNPWSGIGKTRSHKASDCLFISILNKQPTHRQDKQGTELRICMILYMSWLSGISIKGWLAGIPIKITAVAMVRNRQYGYGLRWIWELPRNPSASCQDCKKMEIGRPLGIHQEGQSTVW